MAKIVTIEAPLTDEEKVLYEKLEELKRAYQEAARPIIADLIRIRDTKPVRYMLAPDEIADDVPHSAFWHSEPEKQNTGGT